MQRNNIPMLAAAICALSLVACADESTDPITEQDQLLLDKAAEKLDDQMPEARAERAIEEQQ